MADHIQILILAVFAVCCLLFMLLGELMRQVTRIAEEWYRMVDTIRAIRRGRQGREVKNDETEASVLAQEPARGQGDRGLA